MDGKKKYPVGVKTFQKLRHFLGLTSYRAAKTFGITQSAYIYLEEKSGSVRVDVLVRALDAFLENGGSLDQVYEWLRQDAKIVQKAAEKRPKKGLKTREIT